MLNDYMSNVKHQLPLYLAEFIGTFFLIFFGCGSMILSELNPSYNGSFVPILGTIICAKTYEWISCHREAADEDSHGCC